MIKNSDTLVPSSEKGESDHEFAKLVIAIGHEKKIVIITFLIFMSIGIFYSLTISPSFVVKTTISPGSQQQSTTNTSMSSMISSISAVNTGLSLNKSQEDYYISLMQSEDLLNEVINKTELNKIFGTKLMIDARQRLTSMIKISNDKKTGFIFIEVTSTDPNLAVMLANSFVEELRNFLAKLILNSTKQRVLFYERAIANTQNELSEAKNKFQVAREQSGVISNTSLTENTYSQINTKELQISAMRHFSTAINPDIQRLEAEISALREQLFSSKQIKEVSSNLDKEKKQSSQDAINAYREIKTLEIILSGLTNQYKTAILEATSTEPFIQLIEVAKTPERRAKPQRTLITVWASISGLILGFIIALMKIKLKQFVLIKENALIFNELKKAWFGKNNIY